MLHRSRKYKFEGHLASNNQFIQLVYSFISTHCIQPQTVYESSDLPLLDVAANIFEEGDYSGAVAFPVTAVAYSRQSPSPSIIRNGVANRSGVASRQCSVSVSTYEKKKVQV